MAIVNQPIVEDPENPGNYRRTVLSVPLEKSYAVTTILVCNKYDPTAQDAAAQGTSFNMYLVPNNTGTSDPDNSVVVRKLFLPAGETFTFDSEKIVLEGGDRVVIEGETPANLIATVSYLEV